MSSMASSSTLLLLLLVLAAAPAAYATVYTVGDSSGWSTGVDYNNWLSGKNFYVGDSLYFSYGTQHSVNAVSMNDYNSCSVGNAFQSYTGGSTTIQLTNTGTYYFISGTSGDCAGGMKLAVYVNSGNNGNNNNNGYNPNNGNNGNNGNSPNNGNNGNNGNSPNNGNNGYNPNNGYNNNNNAAARDGVGAATGLMVGLSAAAVVGLAVMG